MKFCYIDESGTGKEPYAVMAGIIADASRMHITKRDWKELLAILSEILGKQISEIHTTDFYAGNGVWRKISGTDRAKIISSIFTWLKERKHNIVYAAVDKSKFNADFNKEPQSKEIETLWCFMALHICLSLQKNYQTLPANKGNILLIFDKKQSDMDRIINLIIKCPDWTNTYYNHNPKKETLDQIIDVPYFADSKHVGLIQVADFVNYFLRRYIELKMGTNEKTKEKYKDEPELINEWANIALKQSIPLSSIYLKRGRCECADLFYRYAPSCLLK